jgi:hypothetical protein
VLVGVLLRVALWGHLPRQGFISDEAEYLAAANWLAHGRGLTWHQGWLWTRVPLYPLFLAAHIRLAGMNLAPIYITQTFLSVVNIVLVYALVRYATPPHHSRRGNTAALLAALLAALFFPFATYPQMLLSETLYLSLFLGGWVALAAWASSANDKSATPPAMPRVRSLALVAAGGILFGLATLTRGLTLGFLPLVAGWVWWVQRCAHGASSNAPDAHEAPDAPVNRRFPARLAQHAAPVLFVLCATLVILPWSLYASRLYGGMVVTDTTGAYNLLLGAHAAHDEGRSQPLTRDFMLALLNPQLSRSEREQMVGESCLRERNDPRLLHALEQPASALTQAQRQQLMVAEGMCLLTETPLAFVQKSMTELVRFFQINYSGDERMTDGFALGWLPRWYTVALFVLEDTLYVLALPLAVIGWARAGYHRSSYPLRTLTGLWWGYILLTAPLLFAINRFRLPFMPFVFLYAPLALLPVVHRHDGHRDDHHDAHHDAHRRSVRRSIAPAATLLALLLALLALTPYAYLKPAPSPWASYLGPYPSSLEATRIAWETRPLRLATEQARQALHNGDVERAEALISSGRLPHYTLDVAQPLLRGLQGNPAAGLALLPTPSEIERAKDWKMAVIRGDLLRRMGEESAAKAAFTPTYVDEHNPVEWAWQWLHPPPTRHIDLAGNLDLGYIRGFYLGAGDPPAGGTFRWSEPEALLRFPQQGSNMPQEVCLRADGRGWPTDMERPRLRVLLQSGMPDQQHPVAVTTLTLQRDVRVYCATLPPTRPGSDLLILLRSSSFVPAAADLLHQQGAQTGQLRLLGVRLDWVDLR